MEINLSWDLFLTVFFLVIVAYSVMIGKDQTIKVILSSYISILASDGIGNIAAKIFDKSAILSKIFAENAAEKVIILLKIGIFIVLTVALTTRGAFDIVIAEEKNGFLRVVMTIVYGFLSAGLIVSTVLIIISGASIMGGGAFFFQNPIETIASGSHLVKIMVQNYAFWFSLPAILFVFSSLFGEKE